MNNWKNGQASPIYAKTQHRRNGDTGDASKTIKKPLNTKLRETQDRQGNERW